MYFIQKEGVNPQGVFGIFNTLEIASTMADLAATLDIDDYHSWRVYKAAIIDSNTDYGGVEELNKLMYTGVRNA